jgi:hypothetical protein
MWGVAGTGLLFVLLVSGGSVSNVRAGRDECGPGAALAVSASETPDAILLRIEVSGDVEPGSVEVRFAGRRRSCWRAMEGPAGPLGTPSPRRAVIEEGASAGYGADGALVMTLRKRATVQSAPPTREGD